MPHNGTLYIDGHSWTRACIQLHDLIFGRILRKELLAPDHYLMIYLFRLLICERWTKQGRSLSLHFHWLIPCTFYSDFNWIFSIVTGTRDKIEFHFLRKSLRILPLFVFHFTPPYFDHVFYNCTRPAMLCHNLIITHIRLCMAFNTHLWKIASKCHATS